MSTDLQDASYAVLKYDLSRFLPIRIVLREQDGKIKGLVENSFSMDLSDTRVRIWWSGKAYSFLGEHHLNGIDDANHNAKAGDLIIDPLSDDCPVEIDWDSWVKAIGKYEKRNAPFRVKDIK